MDNVLEEEGVWIECYNCKGTGNVMIPGLFDSRPSVCSQCKGKKQVFVKQSCPFTDRLCRGKFCYMWKGRCLIRVALEKYLNDNE